ncbi:hypothetical protein VFPPC_16874 [Pochonia chlamydosporia 170]|uniref:Uncharacterized protein n=1 Tax=Pochonia chlamydosporia 170 TaxID=1380566 RepID=A0A179F2V2_METCM|nr:hypothetical protein VFPPC_16874 [Pochonia chlamydosporia 170]OAQ59399.1 hypothetical protein VFPPC_16874 [Pochonia chlamydosporia 170]
MLAACERNHEFQHAKCRHRDSPAIIWDSCFEIILRKHSCGKMSTESTEFWVPCLVKGNLRKV